MPTLLTAAALVGIGVVIGVALVLVPFYVLFNKGTRGY